MRLVLDKVHRVNVPLGAEGQRTRIMKDDILICITGALTGNVAHVTEDWVTLPYELNGLSATELDAHKPAFKRLVATYGLTLPSLTEAT